MTGATIRRPLGPHANKNNRTTRAPARHPRRTAHTRNGEDTVRGRLPAVHRLEALLAPDVVVALEELIDERVEQAIAARAAAPGPRWLTLEQAATHLGCSADAVRMRAKRGRLESRQQGRRVYVSAASLDRIG